MTLSTLHCGRALARRAGAVLALLVIAGIAGAVATAPAEAGSVALKGKATRLTLGGAMWFGLGDSIHFMPYAPSTTGLDTWSIWYDMPVSGGNLDFNNKTGVIRHRGGMRLVQTMWAPGWVQCVFRDWRVTLDTSPDVSAVFVDNVRHPFLTLDTAGMSVKRWTAGGHRFIRLSGISATLANQATDALRNTFGMGGYPYGETFGSLTITVRAR